MSAGPGWIRIARTEAIPEKEGRSVNIGGQELAIFNLGDRFVTIENQCPHKGGPLCDGIVSGTVVVCPLHGWRFDLNTGLAVRAAAAACVSTYPTRVEDGVILVNAGQKSRIEPEEAVA